MNIDPQPIPFVLRFKTVAIPQGEVNPFTEQGAYYDPARMIWIEQNGKPLWANPAKRPYTTVGTPGHTIKGGYVPSGGFKPTRYAPYKMDKRSGK